MRLISEESLLGACFTHGMPSLREGQGRFCAFLEFGALVYGWQL